ncbi:MAG: hypothetical protein ACYTGC_06850 [Planctomycetota bacterium]|jgi:hypothetical protein
MIFLALILAATLLAMGIIAVAVALRGGRPYPSCGRCGYDLSGSIGQATRCPECGNEFAAVGILPPRRHPRAAGLVAGGLVMMLLALGCLGSGTLSFRVQQRARIARQQALAAAAAAAAAQNSAQQARQTAAQARQDASSDGTP